MLQRISVRSGHNAAIYALAPVADGLVSVAADGFLVHWHREDVDLGRLIARVEDGKFLCVQPLPGGGFVAGSLDGGVHWLYPGEEVRNRHVAAHRRGTFSALVVGEELFTGGGGGALVRWPVGGQRQLETLPLSPNSLRAIAYDAVYDRLAIGASDGCLYLLARADLHVLAKIEAHQPSVFTVAFSWDGTRLFSGGRDAHLSAWNIDASGSPTLRTRVPAHLSTLNQLALSPKGEYLATAGRDRTVKLWTAAGLQLLKVGEGVRDRGHVNSVNTLAWLDEQTLVTAGDDRRILEWRLQPTLHP